MNDCTSSSGGSAAARLTFRVLHKDSRTQARCGILQTPHGRVETPVFMPVGTAGAVKAIPHEWLEQLDAQIILGNTYHLYLRPGHGVIRELGGLHRFMSWQRPILTDSGGYQVFSHQALRRIREEGVEFQSHLDGSTHFLSPERSLEIQEALGADIRMTFDECTPYPVARREAEESMNRSMRWAWRCRKAAGPHLENLFGIVQGSVFFELRQRSLEQICEMGFPGLALGGFAVGEPKLTCFELMERLLPLMPPEKPRYAMGIGTPLDLIFCVRQGVDLFDCVLPTRNGRNGTLYTWQGKISIKNARYRQEDAPLDPDCACLVCRRYSRAYLRHLYVCGEILSSLLNSYHNLHFYLDLMRQIRESVASNSLLEFEQKFRERYTEPD